MEKIRVILIDRVNDQKHEIEVETVNPFELFTNYPTVSEIKFLGRVFYREQFKVKQIR